MRRRSLSGSRALDEFWLSCRFGSRTFPRMLSVILRGGEPRIPSTAGGPRQLREYNGFAFEPASEITGGAPLLTLFEKGPAEPPTPFDLKLRGPWPGLLFSRSLASTPSVGLCIPTRLFLLGVISICTYVIISTQCSTWNIPPLNIDTKTTDGVRPFSRFSRRGPPNGRHRST